MLGCSSLEQAREEARPGEYIMFRQDFPKWGEGAGVEYRAGGPWRVTWGIASPLERMLAPFPEWQTWEQVN